MGQINIRFRKSTQIQNNHFVTLYKICSRSTMFCGRNSHISSIKLETCYNVKIKRLTFKTTLNNSLNFQLLSSSTFCLLSSARSRHREQQIVVDMAQLVGPSFLLINWKKATIIVRKSDKTTRWIREAVKILQESENVMNRDEGPTS